MHNVRHVGISTVLGVAASIVITGFLLVLGFFVFWALAAADH